MCFVCIANKSSIICYCIQYITVMLLNLRVLINVQAKYIGEKNRKKISVIFQYVHSYNCFSNSHIMFLLNMQESHCLGISRNISL